MLTAPHAALALSVLAIAAVAAVTDIRTGLIPNRLLAVGLLLMLLLQAGIVAVGDGVAQLPSAWLGSLIGAVACGLIPLALFVARGLGGGDLKLLALCGVGLGPFVGLEAQLYAFGFGCMYAGGRAAFDGTLWNTVRGSTTLLANRMVPSSLRRDVAPAALVPIRFAPWIFAGVAAAVVANWRSA